MVLTHKDTQQSKNHRAFSSLCLNPWRFFWCLRICRKVHEFVLLLCNMTGFQRTVWKMSGEPSLVLFDFPKQINRPNVNEIWYIYHVYGTEMFTSNTQTRPFAISCQYIITSLYQHHPHNVRGPESSHSHEWTTDIVRMYISTDKIIYDKVM